MTILGYAIMVIPPGFRFCDVTYIAANRGRFMLKRTCSWCSSIDVVTVDDFRIYKGRGYGDGLCKFLIKVNVQLR